jgi:hypothetical protein
LKDTVFETFLVKIKMHVIVMFVTIEAGSPPNVGRQNPKRAKSYSHCPLNNNSMNITSASDACLNLHHIYDAAREWTHEDIVDDDGCVACEGVQSICRSILSTVDELLTGDG